MIREIICVWIIYCVYDARRINSNIYIVFSPNLYAHSSKLGIPAATNNNKVDLFQASTFSWPEARAHTHFIYF